MQVSKDSANISAAIISLSEASTLSGLDSDALSALIKNGSVKSRKVGSQLKIYRMSLMSYLAKSLKPSEEVPAIVRPGATSVDVMNDEAANLRDEVWGLKKALTESQQAFANMENMLAAEKTAHENTHMQLSGSQRKLEEALNQIERMMLHEQQRQAEMEERVQIQAAPAPQSTELEAQATQQPSIFKRFFRWLGLA